MVIPSGPSTLAFLAVLAFVFVGFVAMVARAYAATAARISAPVWAGLGLAGWMGVTGILAGAGVLDRVRGSPLVLLYVAAANGLALAVALSPVGGRLVAGVPVAGLVAFQGFRLPLELVLHEWYLQGSLPVQMTYAGHNLDVVTGVLALVVAGVLAFGRVEPRLEYGLVAAFNVVGFGLLATVMSIALRSTPGPLRTYANDPPVLLAFHFPYTWILPVCVAGALFGHVLAFRWLWWARRARARP